MQPRNSTADLTEDAHPLLTVNGPGESADLGDSEDIAQSLSTETGHNGTTSQSLTLRLCISHFLSTWNSRLFEAAVVYFLASIFPDNLLPISIYALTRNAAAIALTVPVGNYIDHANRLSIVRTSIIGQRVSVAASCLLFLAMLGRYLSAWLLHGLFALTVALACVEKVCAGMNLVAVERDWVVVITEGDVAARGALNAQMRRIDLFCKLLGPLAIALIAAASVPVAIYSTLAMSLVSVLIEYSCIATVFHRVPSLQRPLGLAPSASPADESRGSSSSEPRTSTQWVQGWVSQILMLPSLRFYFSHSASMPSFALALLYFTVLSFSGQMLTYLLASHITLWQVGIIRSVSTVFEISATWLAPYLTSRIGVIRAGLWSICWQMGWLASGMSWIFFSYSQGYPMTTLTPAIGLVVTVALSRVGLWGFDLSAQNIVQDEVQDDSRGIFSTIEVSLQNLFELLSWVLTIVWSNPASFQWPVLVSVGAVYAAGGLYALFLRGRRGHLLHAPSCLGLKAASSHNGSDWRW